MKSVFLTHLLDSKYNGDTCKNLTTQITETVKTQVCCDQKFNIYSFSLIAQVITSQQQLVTTCWAPTLNW